MDTGTGANAAAEPIMVAIIMVDFMVIVEMLLLLICNVGDGILEDILGHSPITKELNHGEVTHSDRYFYACTC